MILVTGGTGLIGSYLLFELTQKETPVRALMRESASTAYVKELFTYLSPESGYERYKKIEWVRGNVLDAESLSNAFAGVEYVFHCAGMVSFNDNDLPALLQTNALGTSNIVNFCLDKNIKKLCHVSSIASLGEAENGEMLTEKSFWKTSKKNSSYAISKYNGEREVWRGIEEGLNAVIVNPSVVIGADYRENNINKIFHILSKYKAFHTSGSNGFVDVRDVAKVMQLLMISNIAGERFILNAENTSFKNLIHAGLNALGKEQKSTCIPNGLLVVASTIFKIKDFLFPSHNMVSAHGIKYMQGKTFYSAEKIKDSLDFNFISVEESMNFAFKLLKTRKLDIG